MKRTNHHTDSIRRNLTENNNNNGSRDHKMDIVNGNQKKQRHLPTDFLEQVSGEILDHLKQLGLFDEMRMKLLETIESSREFSDIRKEFMKEIDKFCSEVDLTLPRNRLRERLQSHTKSRAANWLTSYVQEVSYAHKNELKLLYNEKADKYIRTMANQETALRKTPIVIAETTSTRKKSIGNDSSSTSSVVENHLSKERLGEKSSKRPHRDSTKTTHRCRDDMFRKRRKKTIAT